MKYILKMLFFCFIFSASHASAQKPYYVIEGSVKEEPSFFKVFNTVMCLLNQYERNEINGFEVGYKSNGIYCDAAKGPNWWEYYFAPLKVTHEKPIQAERIPNYKKTVLSHIALYEVSLDVRHSLIKKYIHILPEWQEKIDSFARGQFGDAFIIGIDYFSHRLDFIDPKVSLVALVSITKDLIQQLPDNKESKILVSTNDTFLVSHLKDEFGDKVICPHLFVKNDVPTDQIEYSILVCFLMTKVQVLLDCGASLSLVARQFNPSLRVIRLDKHWVEKDE